MYLAFHGQVMALLLFLLASPPAEVSEGGPLRFRDGVELVAAAGAVVAAAAGGGLRRSPPPPHSGRPRLTGGEESEESVLKYATITKPETNSRPSAIYIRGSGGTTKLYVYPTQNFGISCLYRRIMKLNIHRIKNFPFPFPNLEKT